MATESTATSAASAPAAPPDRQLLRARLFLRAALPVAKVILEDDPGMKKRFEGVRARIQFVAKSAPEPIGAYLVFGEPAAAPDEASTGGPAGAFRVEQGFCERPDVTFTFGSVQKLNDFFAGKTVLPGIKGLRKLALVAKVVRLLLALKLMLPNAQPKDPAKRRLKVKMTIYMITTALSQYNNGGDPEMVNWTSKQPERVYQMLVEPEGIAAYLRVRGGLSKAGRGVYPRRRPFVQMRFNGVDGALAVMNKEVGFIDGVAKGFVSVEGSPEYAANLNDFMMRVQGLLTG
jgi:hypothetical protein